MEIEHIFSLRMFSIQGLACGLVLELHSQTEIELDSFINIRCGSFYCSLEDFHDFRIEQHEF